MSTTRPLVEIAILNFNGLTDTLECLQSLAQTTYTNIKITILDNASQINEAALLQEDYPQSHIEIIRSEKNLGFAGGNNYIAQRSQATYLIFLNNDTTVDPGWLEPIVNQFASDPHCVAIQPKLRSYHAPEYFEYAGAAGGYIDQLGYPYARGRIGFDLEKDQGQYDTIQDIFWASGSAFAFRRDAYVQLGGMPESFFFHHEEIDLCWRAQNAGHRISCVPQSIVYHKGMASSSKNLPKKVYFVHRNNLFLLLRNLSLHRLAWVLPLRLCLDLVSSVWYLLQGQPAYTLSVFRAHLSFYQQFFPTYAQRKQLNQQYPAEQLMQPFSVLWRYMILHQKRYSEIKKTPNVPTKYYVQVLPPRIASRTESALRKVIRNPHLVFLSITTILIFSWFRFGMFYASGEEGLSLYHAQRAATIYNSIWYETGTGYPMSVVIPRVPLLSFIGVLQTWLTSWQTQALLYAACLLSGLYGAYLCTKSIVKNQLIAILTAVFYLCNIYAMSQVWGRMLNVGIVLWAYLPMFLYLWHRLIHRLTFTRLLIFSFSALPASFAFGLPNSFIVIGLPALLILLSAVTVEPRKVLLRAFLATCCWVTISLWWLVPYFQGSSASFSTVQSDTANFDSLVGVSSYTKLSDVLLLRQSFLLQPSTYGNWYQSLTAYVGSILLLILLSIGLLSVWRKNYSFPARFIIISCFVITLFLVKGSNPPWGNEFYQLLFRSIPHSQILRNPYEKIGVLYSLIYAMLAAVGFVSLFQKIPSSITKNLLISSLLVFVGGVLVWPIWKSHLFGAQNINTRIQIPADYQIINQLINQDPSDTRIVMLPLIEGDGAIYQWTSGTYQGLESSEFLFDKPTISKILRTEYADRAYTRLLQNFGTPAFITDLSDMNVRYLVIHKALAWQKLNATSLKSTIATIQSYSKIQQIQETENLILYRNDNLSTAGKFIINQTDVPYQKISPTKYLVHIPDLTTTQTLIFKETYHPKWQAKYRDEPLKGHTLINNYANSWQLDLLGTYDLVVELKL